MDLKTTHALQHVPVLGLHVSLKTTHNMLNIRTFLSALKAQTKSSENV